MSARKPLAADAAGLGLRRSLLGPLRAASDGSYDFLEAAPENWIGVGGALGEAFAELTSRCPWSPRPCRCRRRSSELVKPSSHGRRFMTAPRTIDSDTSRLRDSRASSTPLPLPFTEEAVKHVSARIRRTQDILGMRIAVENISYYAAPFQAMPEIDFVNAVLGEADCDLLLDVNNIIVNATNHRYDAYEFLHALPGERVSYIHSPVTTTSEDSGRHALASVAIGVGLLPSVSLVRTRPTLLHAISIFHRSIIACELSTVRGHLLRARRGAQCRMIFL